MLRVSKHNKKEKDGEVNSYLRVRGTLFGKSKDRLALVPYHKKTATELQSLIDDIVAHLNMGSAFSPDIVSRIERIREPKLMSLLENLELIPKQDKTSFLLGDLLQKRLDFDQKRVERNIISSSTLRRRQNAVDKIIRRFGDDKDVRDITTEDIERFVSDRLKQHSDSWVSTEVKVLRSYFGKLVQLKKLPANPYVDVKVEINQQEIRNKRHIIPSELLDQIEAYLKESKPNDWYVYFVLLRYTGCRKNEPLHLKWSDIDFQNGTLKIPSPKTARKNKPHRLVPFFEDSPLQQVLCEEHKRQNEPQNSFVVTNICKLGSTDRSTVDWDVVNPATTLRKLIKKAKVAPWERLCQNIRVTRENELLMSGEYRPEVVHYVIGHTRKTFEQNYESFTAEDFIPRSKRTNTRIAKSNDGLLYSPDYSPENTRPDSDQLQNRHSSGVHNPNLMGSDGILGESQESKMPRAGAELLRILLGISESQKTTPPMTPRTADLLRLLAEKLESPEGD